MVISLEKLRISYCNASDWGMRHGCCDWPFALCRDSHGISSYQRRRADNIKVRGAGHVYELVHHKELGQFGEQRQALPVELTSHQQLADHLDGADTHPHRRQMTPERRWH